MTPFMPSCPGTTGADSSFTPPASAQPCRLLSWKSLPCFSAHDRKVSSIDEAPVLSFSLRPAISSPLSAISARLSHHQVVDVFLLRRLRRGQILLLGRSRLVAALAAEAVELQDATLGDVAAALRAPGRVRLPAVGVLRVHDRVVGGAAVLRIARRHGHRVVVGAAVGG